MRIKKYIAKSMREALIQIKEELGEDAIILKTRKLPKKVFALGAQEEVEVTAAIDEEAAVPKVQSFQPIKMDNPGVYNRPRPPSNIIDISHIDSPEIRTWKPPTTNGFQKKSSSIIKKEDSNKDKEIIELKQNVNELKSIVKTILEKGNETTVTVERVFGKV